MKILPGKGKKKNRKFKEPLGVRAKRFAVRAVKITVAAVALPAIGLAGWWGYHKLITTAYLSVTAINVTGVERVSKEEILELSGIKEGQNILSFKIEEAALNIKGNPWIEEAEVKRSIPDIIDIEVKEREPVALVKLDSLYIMDKSGTIFKKYTHEDALDLPVVTGLTMEGLKDETRILEQGLLDLLKVLNSRSGFNIAKVSEINVDPTFGLSVYTLEEGVRLDVGKDSFEEKLSAFERVLKTRNGVLHGIEAMDLNNSRSVTVRFTTNVVKEGGDSHGQKG
ncbi:MAG: FtsQ-type POTRA domain-containing protein [Deltaproteobacteria bacterium]|nr:FtsQ-type POTRA domain-containing protein [Deltaproteobacteria bacterium]